VRIDRAVRGGELAALLEVQEAVLARDARQVQRDTRAEARPRAKTLQQGAPLCHLSAYWWHQKCQPPFGGKSFAKELCRSGPGGPRAQKPMVFA
jgi:hypothetical protein